MLLPIICGVFAAACIVVVVLGVMAWNLVEYADRNEQGDFNE